MHHMRKDTLRSRATICAIASASVAAMLGTRKSLYYIIILLVALIQCVLLAHLLIVVAQSTPSLEIQPDGPQITKAVGSSLALTCKPSVQDPNLITQLEWRDASNRRIDTTNAESLMYIQPLNGEPGAVLIFGKLTENQQGEYKCYAKYANTEHIEASIRVNTIVDITWVDAPEAQYPKLGQDYQVRCEVRADPSPIVDWMRNGQAIGSDQRYIVERNALLIKDIRESDDGVYTCRALVLSTGTIKTRVIKVEVQVPPTIQPMSEVSIVEGEQASIQCNASGKPPPTYSWIKEVTREDLSMTDRFDVKKNTGLLHVTRVESIDTSQYLCVAENPAGRSESKVKITVLQKPRIFELLNATAPVKTTTKITCKATGRPSPQIMFKKASNKQQVFDVTSGTDRIYVEQVVNEHKGETSGTLTIEHLNRTDDGLYECIAKNSVDSAYLNGHITVEFPPTFEKVKDYPPIWTWDNHPGNLSCIAESIPNATIKWRFNQLEIHDGPNMRIEGFGPRSNLIIFPNNEPRFFNKYECIASNRLGDANMFIELRQATVPLHVQQVKIHTLTATTVKFDIVGPPNFHGLPLRALICQYVNERDRSWDIALNKTWSIDAPYIVENLAPQESYKFRFAARNDVGIGGWFDIQAILMPQRSAPAEPRILVSGSDFSVDVGGNSGNEVVPDRVTTSPYADHFELRWNVPNDNGDPIESYHIKYCVTRRINGEWRDSANECSSDIKQSYQYNSYELGGLHADTTYKIELRAQNAIGSSSPAMIRVRTARGTDTGVYYPPEHQISSSAIIGIVVGAVVLFLIVVDLTCFCCKRAGVLALLCSRGKTIDEEDPKLGRDEKEPLSPETRNITPSSASTRSIAVEYDGNKVYSKTVEIGRHSAV